MIHPDTLGDGNTMATDSQDHIGDRLDHPERVPEELQHLIADDQQRVARILSIPVSGRVLDVGCSDGAITRRIVDRYLVTADGADVNEPAAWRMTELFVQWDLREPWPSFQTIRYDAVYACEVLEHLTDADVTKALTNILTVLKPAGDLIVTVPNRYPHDLYEVGCRSRWKWPDHRSAWDLVKLRGLLKPHFSNVGFLPLYDHEAAAQSIWLIAHARGRL